MKWLALVNYYAIGETELFTRIHHKLIFRVKKNNISSLLKDSIYQSFHHFDTAIALKNFDEKQITLKDVSTLTTIVIKCCKAVDKHFFKGISEIQDYSKYKSILLTNIDFNLICKQSGSEKRKRQMDKWIKLNFPYLQLEKQNRLIEMFERLN